jgi:hypothetical protein
MWNTAPGHDVGVAGGLLAAAAWLLFVRFLAGPRFRRGYATAPGTVRAAALLMAVSAGVHLALVPHHLDESPLTSLLFLADAAAFAGLAVAAFTAAWWRRAAAGLLVATVLAYLLWVGAGLEGPDQVGIATKLVELVALGLALVPVAHEPRPWHRGLRWAAVGLALPALTVGTGVTVWAADLLRPAAGHQHAGAVVQTTATAVTPEQQEAANRLLADTTAAIAPYRDARVAWSAGYRPGLGADPAVHWMNKALEKGPILDPRRPQGLVYVRSRSGGWVLAGAMFQMPRQNEFGPDPGGPITAWHAHQNLCISPIGFAITLASPYGSCPFGAIGMSFPAMLHVWIVDNPSGPFAIDLDKRTVRSLQQS